jgi:hypothetical protein
MIPTQEEYEAAKARQLNNPEAFTDRFPTDEVLADVAVINAYELAQ